MDKHEQRREHCCSPKATTVPTALNETDRYRAGLYIVLIQHLEGLLVGIQKGTIEEVQGILTCNLEALGNAEKPGVSIMHYETQFSGGIIPSPETF